MQLAKNDCQASSLNIPTSYSDPAQMPASADQKTTNGPLMTAVNLMRLPKPARIVDKKSASTLTTTDMGDLGWRLLVDERAKLPTSSDTSNEDSLVTQLWDNDNGLAALRLIRKDSAFTNSPTKIVDAIIKVRKLYMSRSYDTGKISVPNYYKLEGGLLHLNNETLDNVDTPVDRKKPDSVRMNEQLLKVCLHYVANLERQDLVTWVDYGKRDPTGGQTPKKYPDVDLLFDEQPSKPAERQLKRVKEAALVSLLRLTGVESGAKDQHVSELTVERVVGSTLSGIFYSANQVHIISGQKLDAPGILRPLKSFPFPDIAAVRTGDTTGERQLEPVVIIGEAKVRRRGLSGDNDETSKAKTNPEAPTARAQMAAAVHPTLILLVLAHCENKVTKLKELLDPATGPNFKPFEHEAMVYGVYYDEHQVRIYTHFPQVECDPRGGAGLVIRFYQIVVATFNLREDDLLVRWKLAMSLLCVQRHADLISETLANTVKHYPLNAPEAN